MWSCSSHFVTVRPQTGIPCVTSVLYVDGLCELPTPASLHVLSVGRRRMHEPQASPIPPDHAC